MSCRVDTASWISGACLVGNRGLGVRGDAVPSSGDSGPAPLYNDITLPADAAAEVRALVLTLPSAGTLAVYEDSSFVFAGAPDGTYTWTYQAYKDGATLGSPNTVTLTVGAAVLAGAATASAASAGTLTTQIRIAATAAATAAASGALTAPGSGLAAAAAAQASASGTLTTAITLAAAATATATAAGSITPPGAALAGGAIAAVFAAGSLTTAIRLAAAAAARASAAADLTGGSSPSLGAADIDPAYLIHTARNFTVRARHGSTLQ